MNNIEVFRESQKIISNSDVLSESTKYSIDGTKIYDEGFFSEKKPFFENQIVKVEESLSLISARQRAKNGKKTAILNFANPFEPGGGVERGANAQEEYLCRASNLYNCIASLKCEKYYDYHRNLLGEEDLGPFFLASDMVIYTPRVVFFREDQGYSPISPLPFKQVYTDDWIETDVLTCAAPYFCDEAFLIDEYELSKLFERRIKNILEVAIENEIEVLILGAFGCGAFCNPPELVAGAFETVLSDQRYSNAFREVVFSIKRTFSICRNLNAFERCFGGN